MDELTPAPAGERMKVLGIIAVILVIAIAVFLVFFGHLLPPGVTGQCPANRTLCSGTCVDLQTDAENCGRCGFSVPYGETCIRGTFSGSAAGTPAATTATSAPAPARTTVTLPAATTATVAATRTSCSSGLVLCSGSCRDLAADSRNCGACGFVCPAGTSCQNSWCLEGGKGSNTNGSVEETPGSPCTGGETRCGTSCVNLMSDKNHCGVCSRACGSQEICVNARCGPACAKSGTTLCGNDCVYLNTNMSHCGSCGNECKTFLPNARGSECTGGKCVVSGCDSGYGDCDKTTANGCEINLRLDAKNCGSCGNRCPSGQVCYNKVCSVPAT